MNDLRGHLFDYYGRTLGFSGKKALMKIIDESTSLILGLPISTRDMIHKRFVNPTIAIGHKPTEYWYSMLTLGGAPPADARTLTSPVVYLTGRNRYVEWELDTSLSLAGQLSDMTKSIEHGMKVFELNYSAFDDILRAVENKEHIISNFRVYKLPILYALSGHPEKALRFIETVDAKMYPGYDKFVINFKGRLGEILAGAISGQNPSQG